MEAQMQCEGAADGAEEATARESNEKLQSVSPVKTKGSEQLR